MKFLFSLLSSLTQNSGNVSHKRVFTRFCLILIAEVALFSVLFHFIMQYEGREYSWITGVYWTFTVMTTLGFGDITFFSDPGKAFSIVVLLAGIVFFLILLPFTFIQHFYIPWMERQKKEMVPRSLPAGTSGHVLIVGSNPIALSLADTLARYGMQAIILCGDMQRALQLIGEGYHAALGEHDDKETYIKLRAEKAASMVVMDSDVRSANIVFSAHEAAPNLSIIAGVEKLEARDILRMAGCSRCFHFYSLLGEALARRVIHPTQRVSPLGHFGRLIVAEAPVMRTPLAGKTLISSNIRQVAGVSVVGVWERGVFSLPGPETAFGHSTVLMVAGTEEQTKAFNRMLSSTEEEAAEQPPTIIIGGGRVGLAVARSLLRRGIPAVIVDRKENVRAGSIPVVCGEASDQTVMERAGIRATPSIIVTTHDDDANIYLTIYCRRLRPDAQIISRASLDRNINGLHMAGADLVLSLSSLVGSTVVNLLSPNRVLMLNERLSVFRYTIHGSLAGTSLRSSGIRNQTRCSVLAVYCADGSSHINPPADYVLRMSDTMYLIGDNHSQKLFRDRYGIDSEDTKKDTHKTPQWSKVSPSEKED
ncbi:MAG: NAD-binding protein [Desulfovibrionaceae bacterium]|nr:NAD-binding protein [Desulfovibrionaceae bacterium]